MQLGVLWSIFDEDLVTTTSIVYKLSNAKTSYLIFKVTLVFTASKMLALQRAFTITDTGQIVFMFFIRN